MHVHDVCIAVKVYVPHLFGDDRAGQDVPRVSDQKGKQKELLRRQIQTMAGAHGALPGEVQLKIANSDRIGSPLRGSPKYGMNPSQEFRKGEWFCEIVIRSGPQTLYPLVYRVAGGQADHWRVIPGGPKMS